MPIRTELAGDDPFAIYARWFKEAEGTELNDPNAGALATASPDGMPSVRMVLVKGVTPDGFSFFTNAESQKGRELAANPRAAIVLHWKSLRRQVRVAGDILPLPAADVDHYFHSRSRASQIGASVSLQSRPLPSREILEASVAEFEHAHTGEIPRPDYWRGFLLQPITLEFWMDGPARLHDRRLFRRANGLWTSELLYP